jgi:integrase
MRGKRLSDEGVAKLAVKKTRYAVPDPELRGHYIRIAPTGVKSFWVVSRDKTGKQKWVRLGEAGDMSIDDARALAMTQLRLIRNSTDTTSAIVVKTSFEAVARKFLEQHVEGLRSERVYRSYVVNRLIPAFAGMDFADVRRKHIAELLDRVQKDSGDRTANYTLSVISKMCRWWALRDDEYESPIVPGMKRGGKSQRDRILNDDEIAALWKADGQFGNLTKFALLTAQRIDKLFTMKWDDVVDGVWNIKTEPREKENAGSLQLPQLALDVLEAQRRLNCGGEFVFAKDAGSPRSGLVRDRQRFEKEHPFPHWTFHDLRRTARSLMAAIGVPELHAEMVLGHTLKGVVKIYNRHAYDAEKGEALKMLANRIRDIVTPPPSNVENFRRRKVAA